jgi:hypothetical protein
MSSKKSKQSTIVFKIKVINKILETFQKAFYVKVIKIKVNKKKLFSSSLFNV